MARDKLITVRVEEELRSAFNQWAKASNSDASTILYQFVRRCIDGLIDAKLIIGSVDINETNRLDELARQIQELDNQLDKRIEEKIHYAIASLQLEMVKKVSSLNEQSEKPKTKNQPLIQPVSKPVTTSNVDPEVQATQKDNLTNAELARHLKVNPATISRWANGSRTPPADMKWSFNLKTKRWNSRE